MKIGLIGTGYWADHCHAEGITARDDLEFVGIWGRDADKTSEVAARHRTTPFDSAQALFEAVDVVSFAVAPPVQSALAPLAAAAGCHLLLEKPIATSAAAADAVAVACARNDVKSVVNFSNLLGGSTGPWMRDVVIPADWDGGSVTILADLRATDTPFSASPWRQLDNGSLWDVGPHALSLLVAGLGPVADVRGLHGRGDTFVLSLRHRRGGVSTVMLSYGLAEGSGKFDVEFWGTPGYTSAPPPIPDPSNSHIGAIAPALDALVSAIRTNRPSQYDVAFGAEIVHILTRAESATATITKEH
jgi:predicted dehydrogenase